MSIVALQDKWLSVPQAAKIMGVTNRRVRQMVLRKEIRAEQIPAQPNGRWLIPLAEAERVAKTQSKTGRPRSGEK